MEKLMYRRELEYQRHNQRRITVKPEHFTGTFKASLIYWLYGDPNEPTYKHSRAVKTLSKAFPSLTNMITYLKTAASYETATGFDTRGGNFQIDVSHKPFSALAVRLMRLEAEVMRQTFSGLPVLYLHDAVYFSPEASAEVAERAKQLPEPLKMIFK
jgi:hypothetical protein